MEAADPPAGGGGGGGGGAADDGVAPHVAAAAAAPGEHAPAPLAAAAVAVGEHDLAAMDVLEEHDAEQVALAAEELGHAVEEAAGQDEGAVEVPVLPPQPVNEGVHPEAAGQDEGAVEVPVLPPQLVNEGVLPEAAGQDEGAVEVPVLPPQPVNEGVHPQPQQGHVGGDDDDEGDVNQNHQGGLPEAQPQEQQQQEEEEVDLVEQEVLQQEEEIAAFAGQLPLVPFPAPAGDSTQIEWLFWVLAGITALVLGAVMVAELGFNIPTWAETLKGMTAKEWKVALLLALGDMTSLGLTYTPIWRFMALWQGEGGGAAAGIAGLVPPVAALVNVTVWFCYGLTVDGVNASVSIINGTAMVFQSIYIFVFCVRSEEPPTRKFIVLLLGAGAGVLIALVDVLILCDIFGIRIDDAISWSGACTSAATYGFAGLVNIVAAQVNQGADGIPPQALASLANAAVWLAYGRATDKLGMKIANGFGIIVFVAQVGQLLFYRLRKPQQHEEGGEGIHEPLVRRTDEHV